jgi:hypothetical protein
MRSSKIYLLPLLTLLLVSLGCRFAARLSPLNIYKTSVAPTSTFTPSIEELIKRQATATPTATATRTPTSTPNFNATATVAARGMAIHQTVEAQPMFSQVQTLKKDGYLASTDGTWYKVDDFDQSSAQAGRYLRWNSGYQPVDFVIRANAEWWSADESSNLFNAGCGFSFRAIDENNYFDVLFTLDGKARFDRRINGDWRMPVLSAPIKIIPGHDQAQFMLVVEENRLTFFKDGEEILHVSDDSFASPKFQGGDLALILMSGSDIGFGLRCKLTDIDLWIIR